MFNTCINFKITKINQNFSLEVNNTVVLKMHLRFLSFREEMFSINVTLKLNSIDTLN